ncbi:MAG: hypothetical protein GX786_04885 [Clostridiales bacterium]|nr:hypothetical protein [Clostridiales bacterium]
MSKPLSPKGLKNLVAALLKEETDIEKGIPEYETVFPLVGAIDLTITPGGGEPDPQYADDGEYDVITPDGNYTIAIETAGMHMADRAKILGHEVDKDGTLMIRAGDKAPYLAIGFLAETSQHKFNGVWILKARATPITETFHTKEGETITRQTSKISFTAIARTADGMKQYSKENADTSFLEKPYVHTPKEETTP